jgi:4-diphosphocytidyl-2-C-methyl-D-erythritol kinase
MAPLTLVDEIELDLTSAGPLAFTCSDASVPQDSGNLAIRAFDAFRLATGLSLGGRMHLEKRIPHGAGLGGGSSDAASVLLGLNQITGSNLSRVELEAIAAGIGSDVPFFISKSSAWIEGRGERVTPADLPAEFPMVLIKPPFPVPTGWAYGAWAKSSKPVAEEVIDFGGVEWANDLEAPVFEKYVALPVISAWLLKQSGVRVARMSGSGSTIFGVCDSDAIASDLAEIGRAYFGETFFICATKALSRSL